MTSVAFHVEVGLVHQDESVAQAQFGNCRSPVAIISRLAMILSSTRSTPLFHDRNRYDSGRVNLSLPIPKPEVFTQSVEDQRTRSPEVVEGARQSRIL